MDGEVLSFTPNGNVRAGKSEIIMPKRMIGRFCLIANSNNNSRYDTCFSGLLDCKRIASTIVPKSEFPSSTYMTGKPVSGGVVFGLNIKSLYGCVVISSCSVPGIKKDGFLQKVNHQYPFLQCVWSYVKNPLSQIDLI